MVRNGRLETTRERILFAAVGYGVALLLLLLAFAIGDGEGGEYLFSGALIAAAVTTGTLMMSLRVRRH